jgi:hypothetical protein
MIAFFALALLVAAPTTYKNDGAKGNSSFTAVFEAPLGERINAISSNVVCKLVRDDAAGTASGECEVPLPSIMVDNTPVKTEHFQQWATNKKGKVSACKFKVELPSFPVKLEANKEVAFSVKGLFTICGRGREDGTPESIEGKAVLLPAGSYGDAETIRIRAHIEKFDREAYHIGPKWTDGWLARVQGLASVVAPVGSIDVSVFVPAAAAKK